MNSVQRVLGIGLLLLLLASPLAAAERIQVVRGLSPALQGGVIAGAKAGGDSVVVLGPWNSGAAYNGQFQLPGGAPAWNGWTHADLSINDEKHWHVSDYNAGDLNGHAAGNLAAWCGSWDFPSCDYADAIGGYGNNWDEALEWRGTVADPGQGCVVSLEGFLNIDTEPGFDYLYVEYESAADGWLQVLAWDGHYENLHLQTSFTLQPADYLGEGGDEVRVRFRFRSDGGWSDEDCDYWTIGACQLDDVTVALANGGLDYFHDFEDGTLGQWVQYDRTGVGDFAHLATGLRELDECAENTSAQVCWVDDGVVVPGTGGSDCIDWCYGPGGYVVNTTGGLMESELYHLDNALMSPVMAWPAGLTGGHFSFDLYWHETGDWDSPLMMFDFGVRSTSSTDPADIENAEWLGPNAYYFPTGPRYMRIGDEISRHLAADATYVQVRFRIIEYGWAWGYDGHNATPAPYFDNARVVAFDIDGPALSTQRYWLANDGFPASGELDAADPGANSVRFDMATNVGAGAPGRIDPGDSVVIYARPGVSGSSLAAPPTLQYRLDANPVFDAYRTAGLPNRGEVAGTLIWGTTDRYSFDLPDEGFLFPGDELRYYFRSEDSLGGVSLLPADTTGFSSGFIVADPVGYDPKFVMRALPTVTAIEGDVLQMPALLLWDDAFGESGLHEWAHALNTLGMTRGEEFDLFRTIASYRMEGNGLGGRATLEQIAGYDRMVVSCGITDTGTLGVGGASSLEDPGQDVQLLDAWLGSGDKGLMLTGNHVVGELQASAVGQAFADQWLGVDWITNTYQSASVLEVHPEAEVVDGNPVLVEALGWGIDDGCAGRVGFDEILPIGDAVELARFVDAQGLPIAGASAAVVHERLDVGAQVVTFPYDLSRVLTLPTDSKFQPAALAERMRILRDVLAYLGIAGTGDPTGVRLPEGRLSVGLFPNPFNPATKISFDLPQQVRLSVTIYDVKGRKVDTLVDEVRPAGPGTLVWNGTDQRGEPVASGVYFYRLRAGDETRRGKMMLMK